MRFREARAMSLEILKLERKARKAKFWRTFYYLNTAKERLQREYNLQPKGRK